MKIMKRYLAITVHLYYAHFCYSQLEGSPCATSDNVIVVIGGMKDIIKLTKGDKQQALFGIDNYCNVYT